MPVILNLPVTTQPGYIDEVRVYKRLDHVSFSLLGTVALGTLTFTDPIGLINDEYHVTLASSSLGFESLPSNIYRALTPWRQGMGVILQLQTTGAAPEVTDVVIYRRRFNKVNALRIATVALGTEFYSDPSGSPGDEYHSTFLDAVTLAESQPSPSVIANAGAGLVVVTGFDRDIRDVGVDLGPGARDPFGPGPRVYIELVSPRGHRAPSANGGTVVRQNYDVQVKAGGVWNVPLLPNDLYVVPDTCYKFSFSDGQQMFKRVLAANGPAQNFALLGDALPLELR